MDREFGTGALKITPGHDPVDFEVASCWIAQCSAAMPAASRLLRCQECSNISRRGLTGTATLM